MRMIEARVSLYYTQFSLCTVKNQGLITVLYYCTADNVAILFSHVACKQ